jgi:hypothetical protein
MPPITTPQIKGSPTGTVILSKSMISDRRGPRKARPNTTGENKTPISLSMFIEIAIKLMEVIMLTNSRRTVNA